MPDSTVYRVYSNTAICLISIQMVICCAPVIADHGRELRPRSWQKDATINDVFFVNKTHGWVVGDQGMILRTVNGGNDWIPCEGAGLDLDDNRTFGAKLYDMRPISQTHELYPLTCSFRSVFFLNTKRGWIAGNYFTPYLSQSRSVMLTTTDGGKSWKQLKGNFLPQISRIYFQDVLGGWAIGRTGNLFKSGVFATSSGGGQWSVQDVEPARNWVDGELVPSGFVVIDDEGILGRITGNKFEPAIVFGRRPGKMRSIRMLNTKIGWAVGTSGTVLTTKDGGRSWKRLEDTPETSRFRHFDFSSVTIKGNRAFIAGNPGTYIVSLDAETGLDLQFNATDEALPISKLFFASRQQGWAVGTNGMIVATVDGGDHWQTQRLEHERIAMMVVSREPDDLPFGLLSFYANEKNKLAGSVVVGRHRDMDLAISGFAAGRVGCTTSIELRGEQLEVEESALDEQRILEELVRTIRSLRPNALICNYPARITSRTATGFLLACRTAIELAGDSQAFPDQMKEAGLTPWQVDRYLIRQDGIAGELVLDGNRYLAKSGKLLSDQIAISRGLVGMSSVYDVPESYRIESFTGSISANRNDIFYGLDHLGRDVPTRHGSVRLGNLSSIATAPLKPKEFERLLTMESKTAEQRVNLKRQIREFGTGQESRESGIWLMQLAERFLESGRLELAAYTLEQLVNRVRDHAFTPAALMWLAQHYSSDEVTASLFAKFKLPDQIVDDSHPETKDTDPEILIASTIPVSTEENGVSQVAWQPDNLQQKDADVLSAEFMGEIDRLSDDALKTARTWRMKMASNFLSRLKKTDLDFAQSPQIQFMEAMLVKNIAGDFSNQNLLKRIRRTGDLNSEYVFAAGRELRTNDEQFSQQLSSCFYATSRPELDGDLDDEIWQDAIENGQAVFKKMRPSDDSTQTRTDVCWLAHDDEFLFLAVRCNRLPKLKYAATDTVRTRDSDLSKHDRIHLVLDFDRDFQSVFQFEIDYRGWAAERCAGSIGWNPDWYVAVSMDQRAWTMECAIPLNELISEGIVETTLAAFAIRRLDPDSIDLWSSEKHRLPLQSELGIAAGLKIAPKRFEFLRFATLPDAEPNLPQPK